METRRDILARVRRASLGGARFPRLFDALESRDFESAYPLVRGYVLERFMLPEALADGDALLDLADASLRHVLALKKAGLYDGSNSRPCGGASSVITKKVLLMRAVQEDFRVSMTPARAADITTVAELTDYILSQRA